MKKSELEKLIGHKRRHKFGAKTSICNLGHHHPSIAERAHCWTLQTQIKANLIQGVEYEKAFRLEVAGKLICVHKPDFTYVKIETLKCRSGSINIAVVCVDEVKGFKTSDWIIKSKLFQALYPEIRYRVVI